MLAFQIWLYVLGGNCDGKVVDTVQSFDISTQTWSTVPSMREKRSNPGVCMKGDRIVACGGHNGSHNYGMFTSLPDQALF